MLTRTAGSHIPSHLVAINYLVAFLFMSLRDATIPEAMAELAVPCAPECVVNRW